MRKNKKLISIFLTLVLSFSLFGINTFAAETDKNVPVAKAVEPIIIEKSYIQQMLDKLESILNLLSKKGSITIECIDEEGNIILSKTHSDLKLGNYSYDAPEIENYTLNDQTPKNVSISRAHKNKKIQFKYSKNVIIEPDNPETPSLPDANVTLDTVEAMVNADLKEGDIVRTKGYYSVGDNGSATYEIMTYDNWINSLPEYLKLCAYHNDRIGCNPVLYLNAVDEYGNHTLKNGLVAKIVQEDVVKVEQWGLFPGREDNTDALVHLFGNLHTGTIEFGKDAKYVMHYRKYNQGKEKYPQIMGELPWWLNENSFQGNEYALISNCRGTTKPALGNVKDLKLIGNNCEIKVADNEFSLGGSDFAIFETGGVIDGLEITGFNFDCNGLNQKGYYTTKTVTNEDGTTSEKKVWNNMRTCNHGISYFSSGINTDAIKNLQVFKDHPELDPKIYGGSVPYEKTEFSNVNIHHNNFYKAGTIVDVQDGGGDFILLINPCKSENVFIEDNYFEDWGRWVFAVDLGGNGERFYNYKFNRNKCVQTENNYIPRGNNDRPYRGLGWIDFEARKCFTNLEIKDNYVHGSNGFAFNGNGKISENITIENNTLDRSGFPGWRSIYPYSFTFYSVYAKDLKFNNNTIIGGSAGLGQTIHNLEMKNNNFTGTGTVGLNITGECTIENNVGEGTRGQLFGLNSTYCSWLTDENSDWYIPKEERKTNILFKNNGAGGVCGTLIKTSDPEYYKNTTLKFEDNHFNKFAVNAYGLKEFTFDDSQLAKQSNGNPIVYVARGLTAKKPSFCYGYSMVVGGLHFEKGQQLLESYTGMGRNTMRYFTKDLEYSEYYQKGHLECVESGYVPIAGEFLLNNADNYWEPNKAAGADTWYIYEDRVYFCDKAGTFGNEPPTHTYGTVQNGDTRLMFFDKLAKIKVAGLEGQYIENSYYDGSNIKGARDFCIEILKKDVEPSTKYLVKSNDNTTTRVCLTYFNENNEIIKTDRVDNANEGEFTTPENCTRVRVGFRTSTQEETIKSYTMEKIE